MQILEDTDRDGLPNDLPDDYPGEGELIEDLDDDGDGASDLSETGTGIYNGTDDMGTDPLDPDTDDDGICDGPNDVLPQCIGGPDSNPFGTGPLGPTVLVNNSMTAPIPPANPVPGAVWEVSPDLPDGLILTQQRESLPERQHNQWTTRRSPCGPTQLRQACRLSRRSGLKCLRTATVMECQTHFQTIILT